MKYVCTEQYYMAKKALLFGDRTTYDKIRNTTNPKEQKALGRKVKNFSLEMWNQVSRDVMFRANVAKYSQHLDFKTELLATGEKILVEASPYDKIWGIGYAAKDALDNIENWGENRLGKVLMDVRKCLLT